MDTSIPERRISTRSTKGKPPKRFAFSDPEPVSLTPKLESSVRAVRTSGESAAERRAQKQVERLEAEMEAQLRVAKLQQEAIAVKLEVAEKQLSVEKAKTNFRRLSPISNSSGGVWSSSSDEDSTSARVPQWYKYANRSQPQQPVGNSAMQIPTVVPPPTVVPAPTVSMSTPALASAPVRPGPAATIHSQPMPSVAAPGFVGRAFAEPPKQAVLQNTAPVFVPKSYPVSAPGLSSQFMQQSLTGPLTPPLPPVVPDMYQALLSRGQLKPLELPKFSGKSQDYRRWRQRYKQLVEEDPYLTEGLKFARLREALAGGQAEELVADIVDGPGAYQAALRELDTWYGGHTRDINRFEKELMSAPRITNERDVDQLKSFAVKLRNALINLDTAGITPGRELYLSVTQKIPKSVLTRYMERYDDSACDVHAFAEFLLKRVHCLQRVEERMSSTEPQRPNVPGSSARRYNERTTLLTHTETQSSKSCQCCHGNHKLEACAKFRQMTVNERWEFVKPLPVCICCFESGHKSRVCPQKRCKSCGRPHHNLLHYEKRDVSTVQTAPKSKAAASSASSAASPAASSAASTSHQSACGVQEAKFVAFMTVSITVEGMDGPVQANALLDSGSSCSYITAGLVQKAGLSTEPGSLTTTVLGGATLKNVQERSAVNIRHADGESTSQLTAWVLPKIMNPITNVNWAEQQRLWPHLTEVQPEQTPTATVDMLIGLDAAWLHSSLDERFCHEGGPIARKTPLGWVLFGSVSGSTAAKQQEQSLVATADETLTEVVQRFWQLESVGMESQTRDYMTPDEREAEATTGQTLHHNGSRFVIGIPWTGGNDKPCIESNSENQARQRLSSLHRIFQRKPDIQLRYSNVLKTYLEKGYIRGVPELEIAAAGYDQWFLPHFPVIREDKATTKVRIVFDGSAKSSGKSINDLMHTGPKLQSDLVKVLLRFSHHPIALAADISEMFLQVELRKQDRQYHRFIWSETPGDPIVFFEFCRVVFGMRASPYLAGRALRATAEQFQDEATPEALKALTDDFYVDDLLASQRSEEEAIRTQRSLQHVTQLGGFHLRKWMSNSATVLQSICEEDRAAATTMVISNAEQSSVSPTKTLGVAWEPAGDYFTFVYPEPDGVTFTPRGVLSQMCRLFDPRGQLCPFTIRSRVLFQELCIRGLKWDDPLDSDQTADWQEWLAELPCLKSVQARRSFTHAQSEQPLSLHTFTDASSQAYAAVTYTRQEQPDGTARVTLALAKARPAPIKRKTIPMLELQGAVLGARISRCVSEALDVPPSRQYFWTDSMNVLYWIKSASRKFKVDVGNRISEIQELTSMGNWRHVGTKINPADLPSRGMSGEELASNKAWWDGPEFLSNPTSTWPEKRIVPPVELPGLLKREVGMLSFTPPSSEHRLHPDNFSSWSHLVRITAWCRRFLNNARRTKPHSNTEGAAVKVINLEKQGKVAVAELGVAELLQAQCVWISLAQNEAYGGTFKDVEKSRPLQESSPLRKLQPVLCTDNGVPVLKANGRLRTAHHLPPGVRTPIILPRSHRVTRLIIAAADAESDHSAGTNHLLSLLAADYWIVKGKAAVKEHRNQCLLCRKHFVKAATPAMAPLPDFRTSGPYHAFSKVGVDFAGPFYTRQGRGRPQLKRYVSVFTCLLTRACHFELVYSLDMDGFLLALSRFTKRRGLPEEMLSDNGSNFVAADHELKAAVKSLDESRITAELATRGIKWRFNPPRAPHFGGVFEVMVKSMKRVLQGVLYKADLTDEELHTALVQAENLVNSRPLDTMSSDADDLQPLTPQHFLVGHADAITAAEADQDQGPVNPRRRFQYVQRVIGDIWKRWLKEIVPKLNIQVKWLRQQRNVRVGDIVMAMDPDTPRARWPLGRIVAVHPGKDGIVRVVEVRLQGKTYKRAVHRLVPLEVDGASGTE